MRSVISGLIGCVIPVAVLAAARPAEACGGTFCDNATTNPNPMGQPTTAAMPIDQRGENILFVMDGASVEAHIQIQYKGDAPHFAWVIPVRGIPAFEIGSQALFDRLLGATVPTYGYTGFTGCSVPGATSTR
jgi:hypothetical protein